MANSDDSLCMDSRTEGLPCCMLFMGTTYAAWKSCWVRIHPSRLTAAWLLFGVFCLQRSGVSVRLPESGADPTMESDSGFNAMDMAVAMGHRNGRR